jgi:hypothetical protein
MMQTPPTFHELLQQFSQIEGIPTSEIARQLSVPTHLVNSWMTGQSIPEERDDILVMGRVLRLRAVEVDQLLLAAGFLQEHRKQNNQPPSVSYSFYAPVVGSVFGEGFGTG